VKAIHSRCPSELTARLTRLTHVPGGGYDGSPDPSGVVPLTWTRAAFAVIHLRVAWAAPAETGPV
jgi:hypothetical protein